ncbi:oxygenase MpaB family protein [Egicoccus sp. AB-alg2]|uniref:oxygenase MpaB family protein n=1 Tax=Egicoccus sp. AB-alg2 TaxID=3242693 RepID=UPI00359E1213
MRRPRLERAPGLPGVRALVRWQLGRVFGPPPFDPSGAPGDPGLCGPGSASWQVIGEPAAIAGGVRALMLQVAHPLAMAGVADHSAFRTDPLGRLHRTSAYVTASTFGSTPEALRVARQVRRVHPHVTGTAPDGRPYRADDPRLLTWVGVAMTASFLEADRLWSPHPIEAAARDAFVREQSRIAALLDPQVDVDGLLADPAAQAELRAGRIPLPMFDDGVLPRTDAELREVLDGFAGELEVNEQGRSALRFLRWPPLPASVRPAYLVLYAGAVGSLAPHERRALELDVPAAAAKAAVLQTRVALAALRAATGVSPSVSAATDRAAASTAAAGIDGDSVAS